MVADQSYTKIVNMNDVFSKKSMNMQVLDERNRFFGGIQFSNDDIPRATHVGTGSVVAAWAACLVNPDSEFYRDKEVLERLTYAMEFMLSRQHIDGTIDLGSTNYHSPVDTGFVVVGLAQVLEMVQNDSWPLLQDAIEKVDAFLRRATHAIVSGGCHTPNHRWVMTAALAWLNKLYPNQSLIDRAEEWLAEGMDITPDGEWSERSNGIYNVVSDLMLYYTATLLHRPVLLEAVRKNLTMMIYLTHPNGEVVTDYSGRQDLGHSSTIGDYFLIYRLMADYDKDARFAAMSDWCAHVLSHPGTCNNQAAIGYMLYPSLHLQGVERSALPHKYVKRINAAYPHGTQNERMTKLGNHHYIQHSNAHETFGAPLVRYRDDYASATIMTYHSSFFSLWQKNIPLLGTQINTSFTPGAVLFDELQQEEHGFTLTSHMEKGYYGPVPSKYIDQIETLAGASPWCLLPHHHRPVTHLQQHKVQATIIPGEKSWRIRVRTDAHQDIMMQLHFCFRQGGSWSGCGLKQVADNHYLLTSGNATYEYEGARLRIGPGQADHQAIKLRGAHPLTGCDTLSINLLTPFDLTWELEW